MTLTTAFYEKEYRKYDSYLKKPLYDRPDGLTNLQWAQRLRRILSCMNCLNISRDTVTETEIKFAEKLPQDSNTVPFELFKELFDAYEPDWCKDSNQFYSDHPDCVGIRYDKDGTKHPLYPRDLDHQDNNNVINVLQHLNAFGKSITNGF